MTRKGVLIALDVMFGIVIFIALLVASYTIMSNHAEAVFTNRLYLQQTASDTINAIYFEEDVPSWPYKGTPSASHPLLNQSYLEGRLNELLPSYIQVMLYINIYRDDGISLVGAVEVNKFAIQGDDVVSGSFQVATFDNESTLDYIADVKYYAVVSGR